MSQRHHTYGCVNVTPSEIMRTLAVRILQHPWIKTPRIYMPDGQPVPINKVRLHLGGIEVENQKGVTMTIAPYSFTDTVNPKLTATSANASYVPMPQTHGRGARKDVHAEGYDLVSFKMLITLSLFKFDLKKLPMPEVPSTEGVVLQINPIEQVLMDYAVLLKAILTDSLRGVPSLDGRRHLVQSLTVQWVDWPSSDWTRGANAVNHTAHLCVEALYVERTAIVANPVFISSLSGEVGTIPDPDDPTRTIPVGYDWQRGFYYRMDTDPYQPLTVAQITDPTTGTLYSTIKTSVVTLSVVGGDEIYQEVVTMDPTTES